MTEKIDFTPDYGAKENNAIIKVIGVGGGGGNAVKHMYSEGIIGVDFLVCNTDAGALRINPVPDKLVLGESGLGAGANPEVARKLALESKDKIVDFIGKETKMLFITAGMGKGTGTGAAPVIAEIAKEMNILTIGVVTYPFLFEGANRVKLADNGIAELSKFVDSLIVVKNQNIIKYYHDDDLDTAYGYADDVLKNAVKCIAELITVNYDQNIDFNDIQTIMKNSGPAMLGLATASGENRVEKVVDDALACPLLNESVISEVGNFLFFISYGSSNKLKISELESLTNRFEEMKSKNSQVIWGRGVDDSLGESIKLSVIITNYKTHDSAPEIKKTIIPEDNLENDSDNANAILIETPISDHIIDESSVDVNELFVTEMPAADSHSNADDIETLLNDQEKSEPSAAIPTTPNLFTFEGDQPIKMQTGDMPNSSASRQVAQEMPKTPSFGIPQPTGGINTSAPYVGPQVVNRDFSSSPLDNDDYFNTIIETPTILRQNQKQTTPQPVTADVQPMYEVDNDIHDFFKEIPD